ncbi:YHS domain-containing protein [Agromyces kandeliae]|uniref:YHS domain-containing protein n=1 Tax=Agromyces kandeliae TaxID=2666141 RepID=A0A6L5R4B6_9MICO|nr:YHS domain-containing protein [Agromyces kandeliae]MRX44404.1 YHS domain-containing protein [Agromyces kandeliae]
MSAHCCSTGNATGHASKPDEATDLLRGPDDLAECPVMPGSMVVKADAERAGLFRDHDGQRYWFCCAACGPLFDADPERYAMA